MKFLHALRREVFKLHARAPQNLREPATAAAAAIAPGGTAVVSRVGQGCGAGCGCVVDFQVGRSSRR